MHSLETILSFLGLLACAGILIQPIIAHQQSMETSIDQLQEKWKILHCGAQSDAALSEYVRAKNENCWQFTYALHENANPLSLYLGGDSNHYTP